MVKLHKTFCHNKCNLQENSKNPIKAFLKYGKNTLKQL